jgi:hypothetical protein
LKCSISVEDVRSVVQPIAEWLANVGLERYAPAFADNDIDVSVLPHLTDADLEKIGVSLGHRRKILAAVADTRTEPKRRETAERRQLTDMLSELVGSTALSARMRPADLSGASPVSSPLRPAEVIGGRFLRSPQAPTFSPTAADDRHDGDIHAAETGEAYADYDLPSPRWRGRLGTAIVVLCLAGLGAVGAFAYRAVLAGTELPTLPPIIKAENGVPNPGDAQPSRSRQTSIASAGASEEFLSRWPADNQEPPKAVPIPPSPGTPPPSALGSAAVAPIATAPAASPPGLPAAPVPLAASAPAPPSSDPNRSHAVISRSNGSGHPDTSAAAAKSSGTKQSAAAPPVGNQPLSLAPDGYGHSAAPRPREPAVTGIAAEASSGGGYAVAVASERSAADAEAVFRSLQAKFPNQLGGREPIVRRTNLGPEGIYYQASIGPFVSMKAAAGVCSKLKAAGESCLVEKN